MSAVSDPGDDAWFPRIGAAERELECSQAFDFAGLLVMLRHAQPETGGSDPPLSPRGMDQADALGRLLEPFGPADFVVVSPTLRTRQTADALGLGSPHVCGELAPRRLGERTSARGTATWEERPEGGESLRDLANRLRGPLAQWAGLLPTTGHRRPIGVVVSHSEVLFVLRSLIERNWSRHPLTHHADGRAIHVPEVGSVTAYRFPGSGGPAVRSYLSGPGPLPVSGDAEL